MVKLDELIDWYQTLTPETVPGIKRIYHEQAHFRDPFNDVRGQQAIANIFQHMFETTENPVFRISASQCNGKTAWVSWVFDFSLRGKPVSIDGVTRLDFAADGRVAEHRDYWDTADLFVQLPLLGALMRSLRKRLCATHGTGSGASSSQ